MRNPTEVLKNLMEKSKNETYRFQRLYRNLYNPEFYWLAYKNIYANDGSMTAGADGTTIDGMGNERIERIILSLKDRSYHPKPARREYIAKKNSSKKRPLGIQSGDDKLVQEVVKMILESIYEPVFSNKSHGFRPNRSCQTALKQIQNTFTGANWFVEGDIHACFDSFDHHAVIDLLKKRIDDEAFIQLIWKFLKAGYMEDEVVYETADGTMQGGVISPLTANIYLNELDWELEKENLRFVRYADDSIVMCRTAQELERAKEVVHRVLAELGLEVAEDKTGDIDFHDRDFEYLGFTFRHIWRDSKEEWHYLVRPSNKSFKKFKQDIKARTRKSFSHSFEEWASELNGSLSS